MDNCVEPDLSDFDNFYKVVFPCYEVGLEYSKNMVGVDLKKLKVRYGFYTREDIIRSFHTRYLNFYKNYNNIRNIPNNDKLDRHKVASCIILSIIHARQFEVKSIYSNTAPVSVTLFNEFIAISVGIDVMLFYYNNLSECHKIPVDKVVYPSCTEAFTEPHSHSSNYFGFLAMSLFSIFQPKTPSSTSNTKDENMEQGETAFNYDNARLFELADRLYHIESYNRIYHHGKS